MKKITIKIKRTKKDQVKTVERLAREVVGLPKPGKTIEPKKGGRYKRQPKHQRLDE